MIERSATSAKEFVAENRILRPSCWHQEPIEIADRSYSELLQKRFRYETVGESLHAGRQRRRQSCIGALVESGDALCRQHDCHFKRQTKESGDDRLSLLNDDLMIHIFRFMDFPGVCRSISPVSRELRRISQSRCFTNWVERLTITGPALRWLPPISLCRLLSRLERLRELHFIGCGDALDDSMMCALAGGVSRTLGTFDVDWCGSVSDIGVKAVVKACPDLLHFTLCKGRCSSALGLELTDEALDLMIEMCPKLQHLCLTYTQLTKKGIKHFAETTSMVVLKIITNRAATFWGPTCALLERRSTISASQNTIPNLT